MNIQKILAAIAFPVILISCTKTTTTVKTKTDTLYIPKTDTLIVNPNINLTKGLLAYYPFNGNTNDESGNGNNGTLVNNGTIDYDERGFSASALNCHRGGDGMIVKNTGKFNFDTAITVSLNVMLRDYNHNAILTFVNYNDNTAEKFSIGNGGDGTHLGMLVANSNNICSSITTAPGGPYQTLFAQQSYQLTEHWYNVICSIQNGIGRIYINGVLNGTLAFPSTTFNVCTNADLLVGTWIKATPTSAINGIVDEVRIYNRVLNADEIKQLASTVGK